MIIDILTDLFILGLRATCVMYMMFFTYGMDKADKLFKPMKLRSKALVCVVVFFFSYLASLGRAYFFIVLFLEYLYLIIFLSIRHEMKFIVAVKGVVGIAATLSIAVSILYTAYQKDPNWLTDDMSSFNSHLLVVAYLGMALSLLQLDALQNFKSGWWEFYTRKFVVLILKSVECWILLYLCASNESFNLSFHLMVFLLSISILVEMPILMKATRGVLSPVVNNPGDNAHANLYEYYLQMEQEHRKIRKMYHEMKNQVMILKENGAFVGNGSEVKSADELLHEIDDARTTYNTGVPTLNAILFEGSQKAKEKGIAYDVVIEENCLSFISSEDLEHIFRNAILNAIEACAKITDGDKWIKIKAGKNGDEVLVFVKNSMHNKLENGSLGTTKADKTLHGIGLTTIREAAEKYNGYVSVIEEDLTFQLAILFNRRGDE